MHEVRFYSGQPTAEGVDFRSGRYFSIRSDELWLDRVECNSSIHEQATWIAPGPVEFSYTFKILRPFADKQYATLDELGADLLLAGIPLIDHRRTVGIVRDVDHFLELIETHALERYRSDVIFIKRHPDGTHDDIWQLPYPVFETILLCKVIRQAKPGSTSRRAYILGAWNALAGYPLEWIRRSFDQQSLVSHEPPPREAIIKSLPPLPKLSPRPDDTPVVGHDDNGDPITELEVTREGNRTVPKNMPADLIPDAPEGCSDREWEKLMLIEQIKFRRRTAARKVTAG